MMSSAKQKLTVLLIAVVAVAAIAAGEALLGIDWVGERITNFTECVAAGYPILETYPATCRTPDSRTFTEDIGNGGACAQVITHARNPKTGEERDFPTPCDVPDGWSAVNQNIRAAGAVYGSVSIGPICPVEHEGSPCPVPPEAYTSRRIVIYQKDGTTEVARFAINSDGTYGISLEPGEYVLDIMRRGIERVEGLPHLFTLRAGEMHEFNFSINTGIR